MHRAKSDEGGRRSILHIATLSDERKKGPTISGRPLTRWSNVLAEKGHKKAPFIRFLLSDKWGHSKPITGYD